MAKSVEDYIIDFSKEQGAGGTRVKPATYKIKIVAAKPTVSSEKQTPGLQLKLRMLEGQKKGKDLNETLWASPKAYGRFRSLLEACGKRVPGKINLAKIAVAVKGCTLYVEVEDDKREGYPTRSRVTFDGFVHPDDYDPDNAPDEDDEDDDIEDDDIEDEEDEEEDEDEEDEDEEDEDEDEDEDEEEEPEPPKRKRRTAKAKPAAKKKTTARKKRKPVDDDDEDEDLEELDLDDL